MNENIIEEIKTRARRLSESNLLDNQCASLVENAMLLGAEVQKEYDHVQFIMESFCCNWEEATKMMKETREGK